MDTKTRQILLDADVLGQWEVPSGGSPTSIEEVEALAKEIEAIVSGSLEIDSQVQDASFLADVGLLGQADSDGQSQTMYFVFVVRFSNFARLFTICGCEWQERFDELRLNEVVDVLRQKGFTYVAAPELSVPYDGINEVENPVDGEPMTWWTRFFDYL